MAGTHRATTARLPIRREFSTTTKLALFIAVIVVLLAGVAVAAFFAMTSNTGNTIAVATIGSLTDDDNGAPMFTLSGLQPGDVRYQCLTVTKDTSGGALGTVRLYGTATGTLGPNLGLTVDTVTSGGFGSGCDQFNTKVADVYAGTLAGFAATHSNYTTGADAKAATATTVYRYRLEVLGTALAGQTATAAFSYEAPGV